LDAARTCGADHMVLEPLVPAVNATHSFKPRARDVLSRALDTDPHID
jgi:hypothetical protein